MKHSNQYGLRTVGVKEGKRIEHVFWVRFLELIVPMQRINQVPDFCSHFECSSDQWLLNFFVESFICLVGVGIWITKDIACKLGAKFWRQGRESHLEVVVLNFIVWHDVLVKSVLRWKGIEFKILVMKSIVGARRIVQRSRMVARGKIFPWVGRFSHDWEDLPNHVSMWKTKRSLLRRD